MRNIVKPIELYFDGKCLGTVEPPKVNGIPIYVDDCDVPRDHSLNIHHVLDECYENYRTDNAGCQTFCEFLVSSDGWTYASKAIKHDLGAKHEYQ